MRRKEYLSTIQAVHGSSTRLDDYSAGYSRTWRCVAENRDDNCQGFSLIPDGNDYRLYGIPFEFPVRCEIIQYCAELPTVMRMAQPEVNIFNMCGQCPHMLKILTSTKPVTCIDSKPVSFAAGGNRDAGLICSIDAPPYDWHRLVLTILTSVYTVDRR